MYASIGALILIMAAAAMPMRDLSPIGPHEPILRVEKSENPQNILIVYTKMDRECRVLGSSGRPELGFYWLMDGKNYKRVHPMILSAIRDRMEPEPLEPDGAFNVRLHDLDGLANGMRQARLHVDGRKSADGACEADATMSLEGREVRVTSLYTESRKTLLPPFRKVVAVTVRGVDAKSGTAVEKTFRN